MVNVNHFSDVNNASNANYVHNANNVGQTCSSQILYLSNSTKITTNTETTMLSKQW